MAGQLASSKAADRRGPPAKSPPSNPTRVAFQSLSSLETGTSRAGGGDNRDAKQGRQGAVFVVAMSIYAARASRFLLETTNFRYFYNNNCPFSTKQKLLELCQAFHGYLM